MKKKSIFILYLILIGLTNLDAQEHQKDSLNGTTIIDYAPSPNPPKVDSATMIYTVPQVFAEFPGNEMKYISDSLRYPEEAEEKGIHGIVWVNMVVEKDGSFSNFSILRSPDTLLNKEAIRVVSTMPKWIPAKEKGVSVRSYNGVPVHFNLPPPSSGSKMKK